MVSQRAGVAVRPPAAPTAGGGASLPVSAPVARTVLATPLVYKVPFSLNVLIYFVFELEHLSSLSVKHGPTPATELTCVTFQT